ncbi:MAG: glycoside hydrolase family 15 protein [Roseiflexaceae bacterium]
MSTPTNRRTERGYRPIGDYALIGDAHTAALVATDGSMDWLCWPHFDSPAVFCRLLDAQHGGWFRVGPAGGHAVSRTYVGDTNVLTTTFRSGSGVVRLTDLMPARQRVAGAAGADIEPSGRILRLVEGLAGEMELEVEFRPTFDYARAETALAVRPGGAVARANGATLILDCPVELERGANDALHGRLRVAADDRFWITLSYQSETLPAESAPRVPAPDVALAETLAYWRGWSAGCTYAGPYHELVRRSALTLKLLTFAPTGALVAAPTASLPEAIGGARNWDYRYTWLRDASLTISAFQGIGYHREATDFFGWVGQVCLRGGHDLKIMYRIDGSPELPEQTLDHLEGYRRSRPVRIGNAAAGQRQLDVYGEVLDAAALHVAYLGQPSADIWGLLWRLADQAAARWREPDQGIWEVRGGSRHFLYSKLLCWVALDRAIRLAERAGLADGRPTRWRRTRAAIRRAILTRGYDHELGAFTQALGERTLDASALALPLLGFLPATDPRVRSTVQRIQERLTGNGLVYRYLADDGLPGSEATFALCSFWLVDNLALDSRVDEARALFERVTGYANDVGLLAEEIDPASGELLGNYPQGFSHLALIRSALAIARAEDVSPARSAKRSVQATHRAAFYSKE